jgi:hypothetical protein
MDGSQEVDREGFANSKEIWIFFVRRETGRVFVAIAEKTPIDNDQLHT